MSDLVMADFSTSKSDKLGGVLISPSQNVFKRWLAKGLRGGKIENYGVGVGGWGWGGGCRGVGARRREKREIEKKKNSSQAG